MKKGWLKGRTLTDARNKALEQSYIPLKIREKYNPKIKDGYLTMGDK